MQTFHHQIMAALDASTMNGANLTPLHSAIRATLRKANMKGQVFETAADLAEAVAANSRAKRRVVVRDVKAARAA